MNSFTGALLATVAVLAPAAGYPDSPSGTHRFYEVRGAKLYTQTYGHGAPIVFLHGGTVFFDNSFAKQRDYFASYRTVIGIDQRGHGHSPDGPWSLSYKMMADDTAAIIEQLGLGPVGGGKAAQSVVARAIGGTCPKACRMAPAIVSD